MCGCPLSLVPPAGRGLSWWGAGEQGGRDVEPKVWVFLYGSYMNPDVLAEVDLVPEQWEVATLAAFELVIAPRANLLRNPAALAWGMLATATHAELSRLYVEHAQGKLGETYLPEAVLAVDAVVRMRPALCYIAPAMAPRPAERDYVERIAAPAESFGFPAAYVGRVRSFAR